MAGWSLGDSTPTDDDLMLVETLLTEESHIMAKQKRDIEAEITNAIEAAMNEHGTDWIKPFSALCTMPTNVVTGKEYRGLNALWLGVMGISHAAGYKQWKTVGAQVRKGGKGIGITAPIMKRIDKDDKNSRMIPVSFIPTTVFDASQVDGWEPPVADNADRVDQTEVLATVDRYIANTGARITENDQGQACYIPSLDQIKMPRRCDFTATDTSDATEAYYSTALHELIHWTGHKSRCHRLDDKSKRGFAFEELVAEIGAVMLCVKLGVSVEVRADHAKYLNGWLKALKDDRKYISDAAKLASKAIDHLDSLQVAEEIQQAA